MINFINYFIKNSFIIIIYINIITNIFFNIVGMRRGGHNNTQT